MTTPCETQLLLPGMLQFAAWDALPGVSALRTQRHLLDSQPGQGPRSITTSEQQPTTTSVRHGPSHPAIAQPSASSAELLHVSELTCSLPSCLDIPTPSQEPSAAVAGVFQHQKPLGPDESPLSALQVDQGPLEEGELADADPPGSGAAVVGTGDNQCEQQEAVRGAGSYSAATGKRKRGERAGKRVRQRQAKRAREEEQQHLQTSLQPTTHAPKVVSGFKTARPICKYYQFGKCSKGDSCPFPHAGMPITKLISCRYFQQGSCGKAESCPYSHDDTLEPCKQLVLNGTCGFGAACRFSHGPLPGYAVAPLREWFKEQDQLKVDRATRLAQEASPTPDAAASTEPQQVHADSLAGCSHVQEAETGLDQLTPPASSAAAASITLLADAPCLQLTPDKPESVPLSSPMPAEAGLQTHYRSWTDGWEIMYAGRAGRAKAQGTAVDASAYMPLESPYTSWQDGWHRLFSNQQEHKSQ